jgi:Mg2+ and Co2+ transporter CorA
MRIYLQDKAGEVKKPASLQEVKLTECKLLWVNVQEPTAQELALIGRFFDIHPVALVMIIIAKVKGWF